MELPIDLILVGEFHPRADTALAEGGRLLHETEDNRPRPDEVRSLNLE